jgi:serine/threonine protein kinase
MQSVDPEVSICPNCGQPLEETFGGGLGCITCGLRAGVSAEDEELQDPSPNAFDGYDHFGVYKIDRREDGSLYQLGHGAMGVTYRAIDTALQRRVALKIITFPAAGRSKEARESFLREARATAALRHENIATVFQFGIHEETGQCFCAMELVEGETLEERVRRAGPLDVRTTMDIAQQVTVALGAAEERGLIHRDLKPANLMLADLNRSELVGRDRRARRKRTVQHAAPAVKIIDFGLAKALHSPADPIGIIHHGFVGTPAFASPEQFGNSDVDVRSDIYSLGMTLWFALTGKTPFAGCSWGEIRRAQRFNILPTEQLKFARVPTRVCMLLKSMLAFERAKRVGTHELAAELRRCAAPATGTRRASVVLAAAATVTLFVSAFFVFHSLRAHSPPPASGLNRALPEEGIAALPFGNLRREQNGAFLAHQMNNDLLTTLAKIPDLKVGRTATTSAPFVDIDKTVIPTMDEYRTVSRIVKVRHPYKRVERGRTLWHKLRYGWVTRHRGSVKKK